MFLKIGEISERFNLPTSTLRYYDKAGFFPNMKRSGGQRLFGEHEIDTVHVIECLKKSGMSIEDIRQFIAWAEEGDSTLGERYKLILERCEALEKEFEQLRKVEAMLTFKKWYYTTAMELGSEEAVQSIEPQDMPENIRKAHELAFS
ncbi:MerR family transcriptional regulator [Alloscardovia omnicolens]|uniref:MerR family transcriptional regulator n=1 Tax=Alloscardovia omnicolens TaxID=419015 RepID=UPI00242AD69A|nr:MerR family transcriptional regulator [Alloscardovia omnicolens]